MQHHKSRANNRAGSEMDISFFICVKIPLKKWAANATPTTIATIMSKW